MSEPRRTTAAGPQTSRRALIGGVAVGVGALTAGALPGQAEAATRRGSLPRQVDVVVVGGGISGLVAARKVARHGRSVLLVEARDRVGGRVHNHHLRSGSTIESGGAFIGPTQDHIAALARELKVRTFLENTNGNNVYVNQQGVKTEYPGAVTIPPDPTAAEALALIPQIDQYASEIDVAAPWAHPKAKEWDAMTLGQWVAQNTTVDTAGSLSLLQTWTEPGFGADPRELSLLYVLWYVACSGNRANKGTFERNADTGDGAQQQRFVGGSGLIPLRLAHELGDIVALDAAVHRIEQGDGHATVHTARGAVRAQRVIVASTPHHVLDIDWFPRLPSRRATLLQRMHMGRLMKCDAVYRTPFWRDAGYSGFGINRHGAVRVGFDNCPGDGPEGVLLAFVGGDTWRHYGTMTLARRRAAVLQGFADFFGSQALHPIDYVEHDWTKERWTNGGPVAIMGPHTLATYGPVIRKPFGRVHWAGTETATYWTGYMDGAVSAGLRAAGEVLGLG